MSSKSYSLDGHFFEVRVMQLCTILICYSPEDRQAHEHTHTHTGCSKIRQKDRVTGMPSLWVDCKFRFLATATMQCGKGDI